MLPSQTEFEILIKGLQSQNTEPAEIDAKEDLPIVSDGEKAFFIHHVAALANNVLPSYLFIGIEDKSWIIKGLSTDSQLINSDQTQSRMNQILEKKLDPQLAIRYRTYDYKGKTLGLVSVEGTRAPYLIAIDDYRYGGNRTKGEPCFIYRGAIYIRHGGSTVITNRQSRLLEILKQTVEIGPKSPDEFLQKNNYLDVDTEDYGKNTLTSSLVEITHSTNPGVIYDIDDAKSWVSFVFSPLDRDCEIDTTFLVNKLQPDTRIGREGEWYHGLPRPVSDLLFNAKGTPKSYTSSWFPPNQKTTGLSTHVICILPTGHIQLAATHPLFREHDGLRLYSFVSLIGYFWELIYLVKAIYKDVGYDGNIMILLNLIGSSMTYLDDFAKGPEGKWTSLHDWEYNPDIQDQGKEKSIRVERHLNLANSSDNYIEILIRSVAEEIGKYYGQQSPKCFTPNTNKFPVGQFRSQNSW